MNPEIWFQGQISRHEETEKARRGFTEEVLEQRAVFQASKQWERVQLGGQRRQDQQLGLCRGPGLEGAAAEDGGVGQTVGRLASPARGLGGPAKGEEDSTVACREWNLCRRSKGKSLWVVCLNN